MPEHIAFSGDGNRLARVQSAIGSREGAPEVFIWTIGDAKSLFKFPLRPSLGVGPSAPYSIPADRTTPRTPALLCRAIDVTPLVWMDTRGLLCPEKGYN